MNQPVEYFCSGCGYALRGLGGRVCPECGRAFDPNDPNTVTTAAASRHRRRRTWVRWGAIAVFAAAFVYGIAPRGIGTWEIQLYCEDCGQILIARRLQLVAPTWLSVRYPGINRPIEVLNVQKGPAAQTFPFPPPNWQPRKPPESCSHRWGQTRANTPKGSAGACACRGGNGVALNDQILMPEVLARAIYDFADPSAKRLKIHCLPLSPPAVNPAP